MAVAGFQLEVLPLQRSLNSFGIAVKVEDLLDGPMGRVDGGVCMGAGLRVGIGDGDQPEALPAHYTGAVIGGGKRPFDRIVQRVVGVCVAVWPAIHRDGFDVLSWIESTLGQHSTQLIPNLTLKGLESGGEEIVSSRPVLLFF